MISRIMIDRLAAALLTCCVLLAACSKQQTDEGKQTAMTGPGIGSESKANGESQSPSLGEGLIRIESADQHRAGITVARVTAHAMPQSLTLPGQVVMDEQHMSHIGALADGRITSVFVLPGSHVRSGTVMAQIHSHSVHETVGALVQAYAALDHAKGAELFAQQAVERYAHLYLIQAASLEEKQHATQMLLTANNGLADAEANVHMEREHLSELLQVSPESLVPGHLYDKELVPIRSPIDGVVVARNVTVGQVVNTGSEAFAVSNLSTIWVMASLNEKEVQFAHQGASADVVTQGYPNVTFPAYVAMIGDVLDSETRTLPVRVVVKNLGMRLKPGMFATARIAGQQTRQAVFAAEDALQEINGNQIVFVTGDGVTFRAQVVKTGTRSQGSVEIVDGLKPGDRIVVTGAFMVKSELLKGTVGDG